MKKEKEPSISPHSIQVGKYIPDGNGRRGFARVGTIMVKRSNHIPTSTEMEAMRTPTIVLVLLKLRMSTGKMKLHRTMVQKKGA